MLINADLGEGCANDALLFELVDLANIACTGHAGDEHSIRQACELARQHGVLAGAHPSYPDRAGFGRTRPDCTHEQLLDSLLMQVDLFENIAAKSGCKTHHLKPHGQLYNDAAFQPDLAALLLKLLAEFPHLKLLALAGSPQVALTRAAGFEVLEEAFPDRAYLTGGELAPRGLPGALIQSADAVEQQALALLKGNAFATLDGKQLRVTAQTLCVHGDSPHAVANALRVRQVVGLATKN